MSEQNLKLAEGSEYVEVCDNASVTVVHRSVAHIEAAWIWAKARFADTSAPEGNCDGQKMMVTVVIATRNRARVVSGLLDSLGLQTMDAFEMRVVVVDNGSTDGTQAILQQYSSQFQMTVVQENTPGKSRALNRALELVNGDLVVFTDDDVIPPANWIHGFAKAAAKHLSTGVFCGPVIPEFPTSAPRWLRSHPLGVLFFARFDPRLPEGRLPQGVFPPGANFAVRRQAIEGLRFDLRLGPSAEHGPLYDEDTEFLSRLQARTGRSVIVPDAQVTHHFDGSRTELKSLFEKSFYYGLTKGLTRRTPLLVPMWLIRLRQLVMRIAGLVSTQAREIERFDIGCLINFYGGQLQGFRVRGSDKCAEEVKAILRSLDSPANRTLLSTPALLCFNQYLASEPVSAV